MSPRRRFALAILTSLVLAPAPLFAQAPIKIGEINSFSGIGAPFTGPYKLGRRDGGRGDQREGRRARPQGRGGVPRRQGPAGRGGEARAGAGGEREGRADRPARSSRTSASPCRTGRSRTRRCSSPPSRSPRRSPGRRGTTTSFRVRPEHLRAGPDARGEGRQDEVREVGDDRPELRVRQARVGDVPGSPEGAEARRAGRRRALADARQDRRPADGRRDPRQNPDALYVSLFGSDWLAFVREAQKRGLFQKMFVVGILLGEPEYIDPLKLEAPEGMLVTGLSLVRRRAARRTRSSSRASRRRRTRSRCWARSSATSLSSRSWRRSRRRAAPTPTRSSPPSRPEGRDADRARSAIRAVDGQSTMGAWVGTTKMDAKRGVGVMVNHEYIAGRKGPADRRRSEEDPSAPMTGRVAIVDAHGSTRRSAEERLAASSGGEGRPLRVASRSSKRAHVVPIASASARRRVEGAPPLRPADHRCKLAPGVVTAVLPRVQLFRARQRDGAVPRRSGLSLIFGVTRIVNFAHGSFYMLAAYLTYTLADRAAARAARRSTWRRSLAALARRAGGRPVRGGAAAPRVPGARALPAPADVRARARRRRRRALHLGRGQQDGAHGAGARGIGADRSGSSSRPTTSR